MGSAESVLRLCSSYEVNLQSEKQARSLEYLATDSVRARSRVAPQQRILKEIVVTVGALEGNKQCLEEFLGGDFQRGRRFEPQITGLPNARSYVRKRVAFLRGQGIRVWQLEDPAEVEWFAGELVHALVGRHQYVRNELQWPAQLYAEQKSTPVDWESSALFKDWQLLSAFDPRRGGLNTFLSRALPYDSSWRSDSQPCDKLMTVAYDYELVSENGKTVLLETARGEQALGRDAAEFMQTVPQAHGISTDELAHALEEFRVAAHVCIERTLGPVSVRAWDAYWELERSQRARSEQIIRKAQIDRTPRWWRGEIRKMRELVRPLAEEILGDLLCEREAGKLETLMEAAPNED